MIPLRDVIPSRTTPWMTCGLIGINSLVFLHELLLGPREREALVLSWGLIPAAFSWLDVLTSMFLHGGIVHLAGNLLSLWIFGDNVEDRMGHGRFLVFYLLAGVVAALAQTWAAPASAMPIVGSSGAIAGVIGAYFVMFPRSRVLVLVVLVLFIDVVEIPAVFFVGVWLFSQLLSGLGQLAGVPGLNLGLWVQVGGFLTGVLGVFVFRRPERQRVEWWM
jgi:membrane associated rhomboid family serine protease